MVAENQPTEPVVACLPPWIECNFDEPQQPRVLVAFHGPGGADALTDAQLGVLVRFAAIRYGCGGALDWEAAIEAATLGDRDGDERVEMYEWLAGFLDACGEQAAESDR